MAKRIIGCTDGTWDDSGKNTNVYRMFKAAATTAKQVTFYDDGVGADGLPIGRAVGGAFGFGLWQKIKSAYTQLAHVYEAGDELFLFGFSRGAYTARSLSGMITACGLPTKNFTDDLVDTAFEAYRNKNERASILAKLSNCNMSPAKITMLGVWDTVGSLGIPSLFGGVSPLLYGFLDTSLSPNVVNAYHALAINERRMEFPATLWSNPPAFGQTIEQVWFPGVHSDVGGGYGPDAATGTALGDITFSWMLSKAIALGLEVSADVITKYPFPLDAKYALDQLHESWNPVWGFPRPRKIPAGSNIANSAALRFAHDNTWRPSNLDVANNAIASGYKIVSVVSDPEKAVAAGSQT